MTDKTALGDRMKIYEGFEVGRRFLPRLPICVRIDGKRFSRWTRGLGRPYDQRLSDLMVHVTSRLVEETHAAIGYTQSDEISLVYYAKDPKSSVIFDGRIQKMTSVLASMATAWFNAEVPKRIPERAGQPALFDCRCWVTPSLDEAVNSLVWRERDATKNSLSMAARHYYSHKDLHGKQGTDLHDLLHAKGVNWNDYPAFFKRGVFVQRRTVQRQFTTQEIEALPAKHAARSDPTLTVTRSSVISLDMPPFNRVTNRVEVVFNGAEPVVGD